MSESKFTRPPLREAFAAWQESLRAHDLPAETVWIFAENLCVEPARVTSDSLHLGFQTRFTPPADDALEIAYDIFSESNARMVFYRLGSSPRGSVCILLCDPWFESRNEHEGFLRNDDWGISFFPGVDGEIEEVTDLTRWLRREQGGRSVHDLDFAMSLATIDEIKIHGRVLLPYERFAESMLNRLRRMHGNPS
jgi:hypothetical protein